MSRYGKKIGIKRGRTQVGQCTVDDGSQTEIQTTATNRSLAGIGQTKLEIKHHRQLSLCRLHV